MAELANDILGARVAAVTEARIKSNTRYKYGLALRKFGRWLEEGDDGKWSGYINDGIIDVPYLPTTDVIKRFLASELDRQDEDGNFTGVGISGLSSYRSAFNFMYEEIGMPNPHESDLKKYFKGLKREDAAFRRDGRGGKKVKEGKEALPFSLFRKTNGRFAIFSEDPGSLGPFLRGIVMEFDVSLQQHCRHYH